MCVWGNDSLDVTYIAAGGLICMCPCVSVFVCVCVLACTCVCFALSCARLQASHSALACYASPQPINSLCCVWKRQPWFWAAQKTLFFFKLNHPFQPNSNKFIWLQTVGGCVFFSFFFLNQQLEWFLLKCCLLGQCSIYNCFIRASILMTD